MSSFVLNFVSVRPNRGYVDLYLLTGNTSLTLLAHVINRYCNVFVATPLLRDYGDLRAGVYVASFSGSVDREVVRERLRKAVEMYVEKEGVGRGRALTIDVNSISVELLGGTPSKSYVVARLLNNAVGRLVPRELLCSRPSGMNSLCLGYNLLKELWKKDPDLVDKQFDGFCRDNPWLCRVVDNEGCTVFFNVVKCLVPRFQHVVSDNGEEEIYLILHSYYRRLSELNLARILSYLRSKGYNFSILENVKVNYRLDKGDTLLCGLESVEGGKLNLRCGNTFYSVDLDNSHKLDAVSLNPTYSSSRRFISGYLCRDFDKHKDLNKRYPSDYFRVLENDIRIFKRIIGDVCRRVLGDSVCAGDICLGGTCFLIGTEPKRLRD